MILKWNSQIFFFFPATKFWGFQSKKVSVNWGKSVESLGQFYLLSFILELVCAAKQKSV